MSIFPNTIVRLSLEVELDRHDEPGDGPEAGEYELAVAIEDAINAAISEIVVNDTDAQPTTYRVVRAETALPEVVS